MRGPSGRRAILVASREHHAHDIDDGVRSGLIRIEQLRDLPLVARHLSEAERDHPGLAGRRRLFETLRRLLSAQVYDVIDASSAALREHGPADPDAVRTSPPLICFSAAMRAESVELKRFLLAELYRHPQVMQSTRRAQRVVRELFHAYHAGQAELPVRDGQSRHRAAADHVAGMTDRYALREHRRLTGESVFEVLP